MVKDDHGHGMRGPAFRLAALAVAVICVATATGFLMVPWMQQTEPAGDTAAAPTAASGPGALLYRGWPKPDVALVLSGQEHGYLQPCGCSEPQKGGLARRFNLIRSLKDRGWPVVAGDLGDVAQRSGPQALLKYVVSMKALNLMGYTAVGVGENEMAMPLFQALGEYALNNPTPRVVAANLVDKENKFPQMVASWEVRGGTGGEPTVGFVGVVAPSVAQTAQQDPDVRFDAPEKALPGVLQQLAARKPDLLVLLFQGTVEEARACVQKVPQFHVVLCLCKDEEPSARTERFGNTMILAVGHKGRYVGVVGANRTGNPEQPFDLRYELVALDPEYETPKGKDAENPIHALLQHYAEEVKNGNYLAKYIRNGKHEVQVAFPEATYVGSEKCKKCHEHAYEVWHSSPHPHAYETLSTKPVRPSLRQYDGECVVCHVTGFGFSTGFASEKDTPKLEGVGCESCHGPSGLHAKDPEKKEYRAAINPWKANAKDAKDVITRIDASCQKCHDADNDVHFKFEDYWEKKKIAHYTPKD
jgi:hypothetical protein